MRRAPINTDDKWFLYCLWLKRELCVSYCLKSSHFSASQICQNYLHYGHYWHQAWEQLIGIKKDSNSGFASLVLIYVNMLVLLNTYLHRCEPDCTPGLWLLAPGSQGLWLLQPEQNPPIQREHGPLLLPLRPMKKHLMQLQAGTTVKRKQEHLFNSAKG